MHKILVLVAWFLFFSCTKNEQKHNYREEMRLFVQHISAYAKNQNPSFVIIPQNGHQLLSADGEPGGASAVNYISSIDGIGREDLFYGYEEDDRPTPQNETNAMLPFLEIAKTNGVKVLVTDYCFTAAHMDNSYQQNFSRGYISFSADHRELDNIPAYPAKPFNENSDTVFSLGDAKNFLYLINPSAFASKQEFINAVKTTNYDAVIMDLFFNEEIFSSAEINLLKQKQNGAPRKVIAYMSIGEAEDYRYYWKPYWHATPPAFIVAENPSWQGNYKVKYWDAQWQSIIYGNADSYLQQIINAGFDGAYLDIIDAFEYFE